MKILSLALLLGSFSAFANSFDKVPSQTGNYCKDEVIEFLNQNFGDAGRAISINKSGGARDWQLQARTALCDSVIVFSFNGTESFDCTNPQYGKRTRFLKQVWGAGDCVKAIPRPVRP